ncbi:hypothetical protein CRE_15908 [Caenorhabditis remanei]|uniref:Tc1-like transposase DDE domain-containing protein n=1 Tax=Caenorhabditis remanei TaxID=31234 RepID=E3MBG9_CAERE|nr:hypothetical protein CRE_15908 [Caenorhabditis remanei]
MGLRFCHGPPILLRASYFFMGLRFCHGPPIFLRASDSAMGLRFFYGPPILEQSHSHPASVMVFGAVCADGKSPLLFVDQGVKINKEVYISQILEKTLLPWDQTHFNGRHWVFQQDGAPAHTAKLSQQWCETHLPAFIPKDEWPPSSPDLNPLDYSIWGVLQNKVNAKPHSSIEALKKTLLKEWDALSPDYRRATIDAYPRRLRAVIQKRGGRMEQD